MVDIIVQAAAEAAGAVGVGVRCRRRRRRGRGAVGREATATKGEGGRPADSGRAVQVDPIKLRSKAPGSKRSERKCDKMTAFYKFVLNFKLRRYGRRRLAVWPLGLNEP